MSLRVDWFGLAEGAVADSRGAVTLVGFSPDFLVAPDLPTPFTIMMILIIRDDEDPEPILREKADASIDAKFYAPDGKILGGVQQVVTLGVKTQNELPGALTITLGLRPSFQKYGKHTATIEFSLGEVLLKAERSLWILPK